MKFRFFRSAAAQFKFPVDGTDRIAVVASSFDLPGNARQFSVENRSAIFAYEPQALVAAYRDAIQLRGLELEHALVILTPHGGDPLSEDERDLLWRVFRVPVYEQLQGASGEVVAAECEVHDGLHLAEGRQDAPDWLECEVVRAHCECGRETPRLRKLLPTRRAAA